MPNQEKTASHTRAAYILTLILVVLAFGAVAFAFWALLEGSLQVVHP
jgi:hypothetical protein